MTELETPVRELAFADADKDKFLRAITPKSLARRGGPDAARATRENVARLPRFLGTDPYWSAYWTTHRYTRWDDDWRNAAGTREGRVDYDSAIMDTVFVELEHHDCGVLCSHTAEEARALRDWCREQDYRPNFVYSGGKSIHCYLRHEPVDAPREHRHETARTVARHVAEAASLRLADDNAMNGTRQLARVPETVNSATGYKCAAIPPEQPLTVDSVLDLAREEPSNEVLWRWLVKRPRNADLAEVVGRAEDRVAARAERRAQHPSPHNRRGAVDDDDYEACRTIRALLATGAPKGKRYWSTLALIDHFNAVGKDKGECYDEIRSWCKRTGTRLDYSKLRKDIRYRYREGDVTTPCSWLTNTGHYCSQCL